MSLGLRKVAPIPKQTESEEQERITCVRCHVSRATDHVSHITSCATHVTCH